MKAIRNIIAISGMSLMVMGCQTSNNGQLETGIDNRTFQGVVERPDFVDDIHTLSPFMAGTLAQSAKEHDDAALYYLQALLKDPNSNFVAERAFYELVYAEKMTEAARLAGKLAVNGENDLVHLLNVLGAFHSGDMALTQERLDLMPKKGFSFILGPVIRAWSYVPAKDLKSASEALEPLINDPGLATIGLAHLGYISAYLKEDVVASAAFSKLIGSGANISLQPIITYAELLVSGGKIEEARDLLKDQVKNFNNNRFLLREGMQILKGNGASRRVTSPKYGVGMLFYRLGSEFERSRDLTSALIYLNLASYMIPGATDITLLQAGLLEQMDRHKRAARKYASIPSSNPAGAMAFMRRMTALKKMGDQTQAMELLQDALVKNPGNRALLEAIGDSHRENEEFEQSLIYYDQILNVPSKSSRSDWYTYFSRGISHEQVGNWEKAEADLLHALNLAPNQPAILNYLGYSWIDRGVRKDEARKMIEKAVKASPDDGFIVDSLGWVYFLTGDYVKAVTTLERAVKLEPIDLTINDHLGDAYWRAGRLREARYQWQHVLDNKPDDKLKKSVTKKLAHGLTG